MKKTNLEEELKKGWVFEIENSLISFIDGYFVVEVFEFADNNEKMYSVKDNYKTLSEAIKNIE